MNITPFHSLDIVLVGGLYGSGKTEFTKKYFMGKDRYRVSRSELRKLIFEMTNFGMPWESQHFSEETDFMVKHVERRLVEQFLHDKKKVVIINTFTNEKSRKRFISLAKELKKSIGIVFLNTSLEVCIEKNKNNAIQVPAHVLTGLNLKKELPSKTEGFNEVIVVENFE
ncbi:MAG: hypothetical protein CVV44_18340 [Spirochaetae bacterium HGW-Spirochaetae-1]|jgi:predicted kinase|nr:MAG: hypothetical protein CVV44_18340 [Spirochaetae bacterium HGW-Spirochaetae-1]